RRAVGGDGFLFLDRDAQILQGRPVGERTAAAQRGVVQVEAERQADAGLGVEDQVRVALDVGDRPQVQAEVGRQLDAEKRYVGERDLEGQELVGHVVVDQAEREDLRKPVRE